jgi:cyclopropane fatty-acyl-phospholipid synthase-like methyltransferase
MSVISFFSLENIVYLLSYIVIFTCIWIIWPTVIGAIFVPTPIDIVEKMLEVADLREDDILYDLGSGDGRFLIEAADSYNSRAVGIEADPIRVLWSRFKIRSRGFQKNIRVIWGNFFNSDLSEATVVTVYQGQGINSRLIEKLENELKPGTRVVSYSFTFEKWKPKKEYHLSKIFLYII